MRLLKLFGVTAVFFVLLAMSPSEAAAGSAVLSWSRPASNTDGSSLQNLAGFRVYIGTSPGAYTKTEDAGDVITHTVSSLVEGQTYYFAVTAYNAYGVESELSQEVSKQINAADSSGPVITGVYADGVIDSSALINWATDEPADSRIEYGTTAAYGYENPLDSVLSISHAVLVGGLAPSTTYHYRVISTDASGNTTASADYTFTTAESSDVSPPAISNVSVSGVTSDTALISWETNENSTTEVVYQQTAGQASSSTTPGLTTVHSVTLSGLVPGVQYSYVVKSKDPTGNSASSGTLYFKTSNAAPVISSFRGSVSSGLAPLQVAFTASASDQDGSITKYEWDFDGDGVFDLSTGVPEASTTYSFAGAYNAKVRVHDTGGLSVESEPEIITVETADNKPPLIESFTASENEGRDLSVIFRVAAADPNGNITAYEWDFDGNGTVDAVTTDMPASYTYLSPGSYNPVVTVVDNQGAKSRSTIQVTVAHSAANLPAVASGQGTAAKGMCFVASAAYGSYLEPEVEVLREFRDNVLLTNPAGAALVSFYYRVSPPLAEYIVRDETLRTIARAVLTPIVYSIKYPGLAFSGIGAAAIVLISRRRR